MKLRLFAAFNAAVFVALTAIGLLYAQQKPGEHQHEAMEHQHGSQAGAMTMPASKSATDEEPGVFCPTMKTGQLCSHGTSDLLKLSGDNRDQWIAAVRRYNKSVDDATAKLQEDAAKLLTPQQAAEVERWFAKGLNPEINKLLLSGAAQKTK